MEWHHRFRDLTEDWGCILRRDGWQTALPAVTKDIISLPYRRLQFTMFACSLTEPLPEIQPKVPLTLHPFERFDLEFVRQTYLPSEANLCAQRLKMGHHGLVACISEQPAGYGWGCADMTLERIDWTLAADTILCTDAFTAPAFRGRGVQTILALERLRLFQGMGYKTALAYIEVHNKPSIAVWRKFNAQPIAHFDFKRIGFWRQTTLQS